MVWCPSVVSFEVQDAVVWRFAGEAVPDPDTATARTNLWLMGGQPPAGDGVVRVAIASFRHTAR